MDKVLENKPFPAWVLGAALLIFATMIGGGLYVIRKADAPLMPARVEQTEKAASPMDLIRAQIAAGLPDGTFVQMKPLGPRTVGEIWVVPPKPHGKGVLLPLRKFLGEMSAVTDGNIDQVQRIIKPEDPNYAQVAQKFFSRY